MCPSTTTRAAGRSARATAPTSAGVSRQARAIARIRVGGKSVRTSRAARAAGLLSVTSSSPGSPALATRFSRNRVSTRAHSAGDTPARNSASRRRNSSAWWLHGAMAS